MTRIEEDGKKTLWSTSKSCQKDAGTEKQDVIENRERERSIKKNIYKRSKIKRNKREGVDWYCRFY